MAREEIRVDIVANDEASVPIDKVTEKAEKLDKQDVLVRVDVETDKAEGGLRRVGQEADQSRSVLANTVGNATQDLGELGGVAGTAGVTIGQLGEYAAEGSIQLSNLAAVAGPMAALAIGTTILNKVMADNAKKTAELKKITEGYAEALGEADAATAVTSETIDNFVSEGAIKDVARLGVNLDVLAATVTGTGEDIDDLQHIAANLGVNLVGGSVDIDEWRRAMEAAGVPASDLTREVERLISAGDLETGTVQDLSAALEKLNDGYADGAEDAEARRVIEEALAGTTDQHTAAIERQREVIDAATEAADEWLDKQLAMADAQFAATDAFWDSVDAIKATQDAIAAAYFAELAYNQAVAEHGPASEEATAAALEFEAANRAVAAATRAERDAAREAAATRAAALGPMADAEAKLDAMNASLLESARTATPAAKDEIIKYIAEINGISEQKATEIVANADSAAAAAELDALEDPRYADVHVRFIPQAFEQVFRARPGPGGGVIIGTQGMLPEAPVAPPAAGVQNTYNINLPRGSRATDVIRTMEGHARRNGTRVGAGRRRR